MGERSDELERLFERRFAAFATDPKPVWLWSSDGSRVVWANPQGVACLGAEDTAALTARRFATADPLAAQIIRISAGLYTDGSRSLHRLRGLAPGFGRLVLCACTRVVLDRSRATLLVAAQEPAGPTMPLAERARRLLADFTEPLAAFSPDGRLLAANAAGLSLLGGAKSLTGLGGGALPDLADAAPGTTLSYTTARGPLDIVLLGSGEASVLLALLAIPAGDAVLAAPVAAPAPAPAPAPVEPVAQPAPLEIHEAAPISSESPVTETPAPEIPVAETPVAEPPEPDEDADAAPIVDTPREEPPLLRIDPPIPDRRYPLRFVWQIDQAGRFTLGSNEFTEAIGPEVAAVLGRPWQDINEELGLDPSGRVLRAIGTQDTWSGITVSFPVEGSDDRLEVEMSGLPVYDRDRVYLGYRGFGVCRDMSRIAMLGRARRAPIRVVAEAARSEDAPAPHPDEPHLDAPAPDDIAPDKPAPEAAAPLEEAATIAPATPENVVTLFPTPNGERPASAPSGVGLSSTEHNAFREIARQLHARLAGEESDVPRASPVADADTTAEVDARSEGSVTEEERRADLGRMVDPFVLLDRLPVGLLVYRYDQLLYANRAFLDTTGYPSLDGLTQSGGLDSLFVAGDADVAETAGRNGQSLAILTRGGDRMPVAARLFTIPSNGETALALMLVQAAGEDPRTGEAALRRAEATIRELRGALDIAFDGVVLFGRDGRIVSANHSAEVLFGAAPGGLDGQLFAELFAADSRVGVFDYVERVRRGASLVVDEGREAIGRVRQGGTVPLFMMVGTMTDDSDRLCAVFRDLTATKTEARSLSALRSEIDRSAAAKAELVAKLSHDLRSPLAAIVGFSELMLAERFGPISNDRYAGYVRDMRAAAQQMTKLIEDTMNLSRAESGSLELAFSAVDLNDLVQETVRALQPQAAAERIIVRTSLAPHLQPILADPRSLQQIVTTLLTNAISLTGKGGQVIVSTGHSEQGQVVLRVRDTGAGMTRKDLETILEPFKELSTVPPAGAPGLGLPLTKALAEANRGTFNIVSRVNDGTLVEVTFPRPRISAE